MVSNDEEFAYSVEKFEFELFDHFKTNKIVVSITATLLNKSLSMPFEPSNSLLPLHQKQYPITLPYSRSVVEINYNLASFIEKNMDYWQFLL